MDGSKAFDWKLFVVLAVVNFAAVVLNHIDDTDETYGYWEPLHYLLYGKGMQTWEYDPVFAIRSYAFVFPLFLIGDVLRKLGVEKIALFYCLRGVIGLFSTYSQYSFLSSLSRKYGKEAVAAKHNLGGLVAIFLLLSPGVFFASTSFLPSAFSMTLTMLSVARWLDGLLLESIFWGSLAVLGTGWPFVGLIFLPLGFHMLVHSYQMGGFLQIIKLCVSGLVVVSLVLLPVTAIDFIHYDQPTIPFWNILTYNTGNRGDELYGIEPASYYVKNLLLTTGLAVPFASFVLVAEPVQYVISMIMPKGKLLPNHMDGYMLTIYVACALWLGVLFSRPHKEERFLYPAYPLLAFAAARSFLNLLHLLKTCFPVTKKQKYSVGSLLQTLAFSGMVLVMLLLFSSRVFANVRNYHGYMATWQDLHHHILQSPEYMRIVQAKHRMGRSNYKGKQAEQAVRSYEHSLRVCVGSEWHLFPTHFFLPSAATLFYIEDGFHGILPQHFEAINGTSRIPPLPNNGENQEEVSRYIDIDECHFIVTSNDAQTIANRLSSANLRAAAQNEEGANGSGDDAHASTKEAFQYVELVSSRPVLDRDATKSPLVRALYLPHYVSPPTSPAAIEVSKGLKVAFKPYQILRVVNGGQRDALNPIKVPTKDAKTESMKPMSATKSGGVGSSILSSILGSGFGGQKVQVKNEMTKEQLAERLGLAARRQKKAASSASSSSSKKVSSAAESTSPRDEETIEL